MGPSAVVRHRGLTILLTSKKLPPFDLGQWRSQGINPEELSMIGIKAAVGHRVAYGKIASASSRSTPPAPAPPTSPGCPTRSCAGRCFRSILRKVKDAPGAKFEPLAAAYLQ